MSYDKAMKHSIRKSRKQGNNYFGFHTGEGQYEAGLRRKYLSQLMEVDRWFRGRHDNDKGSQYARECVRQAIVRLRQLRVEVFGADSA